jgi:mRNA capping enzyme
MHYLFETENKLRTFLHNVSCRLEAGGFFIGTTIDADRVVARIRTEGQQNMRIGNKFYSI